MSSHIKTWQQRVEESYSEENDDCTLTSFNAALYEIAELRAALAGDEPEHGEPFMYKLPGDYDWHVGFSPLPEGAFRIKELAAAPVPQQAAGDALELPALPDMGYWQEQCMRPTAYTAEQMAAYGRACMLATAPSPPSEGEPQ